VVRVLFEEALSDDQGEESQGEKRLENAAAGGGVHESKNLSAGVVVARSQKPGDSDNLSLGFLVGFAVFDELDPVGGAVAFNEHLVTVGGFVSGKCQLLKFGDPVLLVAHVVFFV
jgi:hypothetical protein